MFLATSGLLCLHDQAEPRHFSAVELYQSGVDRFTHAYVLAEFVALANARKFPRSQALELVTDLLDRPDIEMIWVDKQLHREAMALIRSRWGRAYSLCDSVCFVLMKRKGIIDGLTTDHHFEQEGFRRLLI